MERDILQTTKTCAIAAHKFNVEFFVQVSTGVVYKASAVFWVMRE